MTGTQGWSDVTMYQYVEAGTLMIRAAGQGSKASERLERESLLHVDGCKVKHAVDDSLFIS